MKKPARRKPHRRGGKGSTAVLLPTVLAVEHVDLGGCRQTGKTVAQNLAACSQCREVGFVNVFHFTVLITTTFRQVFLSTGAHVGVDSQTKLIHSVVATAANAVDCTMLSHLLHGEETRIWGDQAYRGQTELLRKHAPRAQDFTHQRYKKRIDEIKRAKNRTKSSVRGLDKNANRLFSTCALVNLFLMRKRLCVRPQRSVA